MLRKIVYVLFALVCGAPAANAATLCAPDETVLFNCSATEKRIISVCASQDLAPDHGFLQYRFGRPGKVELTVPADNTTPPSQSAIGGSLIFSGGGGAYLRFTVGAYQYVVFTATGKWGPSGSVAGAQGVAVQKNGKEFSNFPCVAKYDPAEEYVNKMGPHLFERLRLKKETDNFDIPDAFLPRSARSK